MPPRRSTRVTAATARVRSSALPPLPHALVLDIFARLPADARARCKLVSRGWLSVLIDERLWTHLNLSRYSGGVSVHVTDSGLRSAAGFARGGLVSLELTLGHCSFGIKRAALLAVVKLNAGALRELTVSGAELNLDETEALARAGRSAALRVQGKLDRLPHPRWRRRQSSPHSAERAPFQLAASCTRHPCLHSHACCVMARWCQGFKKCLFLGVPSESCSSTFRVKPTSA